METSINFAKDDGKENLDSSYDKLKDTHFDEVFEEAIDVLTPIIDSENRKKIVGGNIEPTMTLENGEQSSNSVSEIQNPEEAIVVSDAALGSENFDAHPDLLMNELRPDIDVEKVVMDATNGLHDGTSAEEKEVELNEVVDLAPNDGETDNPSYKDSLLKNLKPEDSVLENATSLETLTSEDSKNLDVDTGQEPTAEVFETPKFNEWNGIESDSEKPDMKKYIYGMAEIQDGNDVKGGDIGFMKPANGLSNHVTLTGTLDNEDTKTEDVIVLREQSEMTSSVEADGCKGDSRPQSKSNGDVMHIDEQDAIVSGADPQSESMSNGDVIHNIEKHDIVSETGAILGSGNQQGKSEILANQLELKEDWVGEQEEAPYNSVANLVDDGKIKLKQLGLENVKLQKVDSQNVVEEENKGVVAADTTASDDVKEGSGVNTNVPALVANGTANMEMEIDEKPHSGSSELSESSTSCEKEFMDASAAVSEATADAPEKEAVKDDMNKHVSGKREHDGGHMISSSSYSAASTTYPPGPENTTQVLKAVSDDTSVNREKEVKPKGEISSSATVTTSRPAGLGNTAPLFQSTQSTAGNKESACRSVADAPSIKIASASTARPAGLGFDAPLLEPTTRVAQQPRVNGATSPPHNQLVEDHNGDAEEYDETREKLQMIRVKFLRLAHRLGQTPHNVVVAQVLYRLGLAEQLRGRGGGRVGAFSFDRASAMAEQLEASGQEPLDFTCTIMVLGKSGVGKSATINSIFDEVMFATDAFQLGTKKVQDIVGTVQGIRVRVIDTPGLLPSWSDQHQNEKILHSVKRFIKKTPPDIVLYLDRLDMQGRDFIETPLLRTITEIFGPSIWFNAIVVLTHAASAPPEGPNGTATSYDMFVTQRSHIVQQAIRQAAGDMRLMNPVSLVENHSACRTNRAGQRVLPNGQVWKPHLLLLSFASKILAEANTLLKLQDSPPGRPFASRTRSPPLPFLLSSLLQSRPEVKLPSQQFGEDDDAIDDDLDDSSDSEDDVDYDELPPFKSLTKAQLEKLPKSQRKAYYDELEYREKLMMKKQLKEEKKRRKMMKKMQEAMKDLPPEFNENAEEESAGAASLPVPMPDLALPASFDSDNPTHRYRSLDSNPWLVRAVLEPNGWDHDIGYDGINVERLFVVKEKMPISFSGHISKDKKDANLQMEFASSVKHGKGKATSLGFDMQSVGKDMAYTMRSETRFSNHRINKAAAGFSATLLGDVLTGGIKVEDKLLIGKRGQLVVSGGGIYGRGDIAYGGSLEATLRDKDHPLGRFLSTLGVSVMDWHGDLATGCNFQTQIPVGRHSNLIARFNINNKGSGQVSVRINSSEQLQIVLLGLIPLVKKFLGDKSS